MATLPSQIGTETLTAGGQRIIDMSANAQFYDNDATKILAILHKANLTKEVSGNREFNHREDDLLTRSFKSTGLVTASTTLTAAAGNAYDLASIIRVDDILFNPVNKEVVLVTVSNAGTPGTATIVRAYGVEAAKTTTAGTSDVWIVLGNAKPEGTGVRTVLMTTETKVTNYTQEFSMPVKTNWELEGQKLYGTPERRKQQYKLGIDHQKDIALSLWFGQKNSTTNQTSNGATTNTPRYATHGIVSQVEAAAAATYATSGASRLLDMGGTMTENEWEDWLRACKRYNQSGEMWTFASSLVWSVVTRFARNNIMPNDMMTKQYGFEITDYVVPGLRVHLVEEKIFDEFFAGSGLGASDLAVCLDMAKVLYRYQEGWDTKLIEDIVKDGTHAYVDEYLTICGPQVFLPKAHGIAKNITG